MLFSLTASAYAQRGNRSIDPKERAKKEVDAIKKQLKLSEKKEKDCYDAHFEHYKNHQELFKKNYTREKRREEILKERKNFHKKLQGILTKEQHIMYMNIQKEKDKKMKEGMGKRRDGQRGQGRGQHR